MKVVFVSTMYAPYEVGGAERAVRVIAESLVEAGGQAVVICLAPDGISRTEVWNGVKVYYVPLFNFGFMHGRPPMSKWRRLLWHIIDAYNPWMGSRVGQLLKEEQPDIVETNNLQGFSVAVWRAAEKLGLPVVQIVHDYYLICSPGTMYRRGRNCAGQCRGCAAVAFPRRAHSNIPRVVSAVSQRTLDRMLQAGAFSNVAHKSVGPTAIRLVNSAETMPRARHSVGAEVVVGYLGRVEAIKGVDSLLQAVSGIDPRRVRAVIAGTGPAEYIESLRDRYAFPNIEFLGVVDPPALFSRIHVLFVPSLWDEPLTRVIAEAYACGIPVAVSRMGGMPEIVDEGVTGYLFPPGDVEAIKKIILKIGDTDLPAPKQVEACLSRSQEFSVENVFRRHQMLWKKALPEI